MSRWGCMRNLGAYRLSLFLLGLMLLFFFNATVSVAEPDRVIRVGVREVRPFIIIDQKQQRTGYSIDIWNAIADELGVDTVSFKTAQLYDFEEGNPLMPENQQYSRYKQGKDGKFKIKNKLYNHCWKMWHSAVITWDTKVVPCCFDKDAHYQLGQLGNESFKEVWQSNNYNQFRKSLLKGRDKIDICRNCTEGTKVWT